MKKDIIWLSAYPKSGRTWLKILLNSIIYNNGNAVDLNQLKIKKGTIIKRIHFDRLFGIPSTDLTLAETLEYKRKLFLSFENSNPNYILTHDENILFSDGGRLFPESISKSGVHIVRNPLSVVASLANHLGISIDESIAVLNSPTVSLGNKDFPITTNVYSKTGSWSTHINSWIKNTPYPVHMLRYEDLVLETRKTLNELLHFLELKVEDSTILRAIENSTFKKLASAEHNNGFIEKPATSKGFFRKGKIDGWKEELTEKQIKKVIDNHGDLMQKLGYI